MHPRSEILALLQPYVLYVAQGGKFLVPGIGRRPEMEFRERGPLDGRDHAVKHSEIKAQG